LIAISVVLFLQWRFIKDENALGFNIDKLLVVDLPSELQHDINSLTENIKQIPSLKSISSSSGIPLYGPYTSTLVYDMEDYSKKYEMDLLYVGADFFKTFKINITEGRCFNFSTNYDISNAVILNKAAVKLLNIKNPIGKKAAWKSIVGVTDDFKFYNMYEKTQPIVIYPKNESLNYLIIR
jgi:hypothetical protein